MQNTPRTVDPQETLWEVVQDVPSAAGLSLALQ